MKTFLISLLICLASSASGQSFERVHLTNALPFINVLGVNDSSAYYYQNNIFNWSNSRGIWEALQNVAPGNTFIVKSVVLAPSATLYVSLSNGWIVKSNDGGTTFSRLPLITQSNLFVTPSNEVFLYVGNQLLRSGNEGTNWDTVSLPSTIYQPPISDRGGNLYFIGRVVYRLLYSAGKVDSLNSPGFASAKNSCSWASGCLVISDENNLLYSTRDSGLTWNSLPTPNQFYPYCGDINSLCCDSAQRMYAATRFGYLFRSLDSGSTWRLIDSSHHITNVTTGGKTSLWIGNGLHIYRMSTNDLTIEQTDSSASHDERLGIWSLAAKGDAVYAGAEGEGVFRSVDEGDSWVKDSNLIARTGPASAISFSPKGVMYFWDGYAHVFRSINGKHWDAIVQRVLNNISVLPVDSNGIVYLGSYRSQLNNDTVWQPTGSVIICQAVTKDNQLCSFSDSSFYRSSDGGVSWSRFVIHDSSARLSATIYCMPEALWLCFDSVLLKSTDNGETWQRAMNGLMRAPSHQLLARDPFGYTYCVQGNCAIFYWIESINSWERLTLDSSVIASQLYCNSRYIFIGTERNGLYRRLLSMSNLGVRNFAPSQNSEVFIYPNPAQHQMAFRYTLRKRSQVDIAIFDMLGREVQHLSYGVRLSGPNVSKAELHLSPGTYFLKLTTSEGYSVGRFVVSQ